MMGISYQKKRQTPKRKAARSNRAGDATSEQAAYRLLRLFYKKSERTHSAAPPFQITTAALGSRLGIFLSTIFSFI